LPEALAVSVRGALAEATSRLSAAGCDTPRLDAELLLASALSCDRARLVLIDGVGADAAGRFEALLARRAAREPVAYILGRKEFRRIALSVDRRVLIPRPETEHLVEVGLSLEPGARVLDVGSGSGAVALALVDERPDLSVTGVDSSEEALDVARANAARLGLQVSFVRGDLLAGVEGEFDAVLANLPYVSEGSPLPPEVALYEPPAALFAGPDGLDAIRRLMPMLSAVPLVGLEVGFDQAAAVGELLRAVGFQFVEVVRDLAGHDRVLVGRRS
jgi:release factor glutamine methyltransferase